MGWLKLSLALVAGLAVVWATLLAYGHWRWQGRTERLLADLAAARVPVDPRPFDPAEIGDLPPPVQRFFSAALTPGQLSVSGVSILHAGTFNMGEDADNWKPFTSRQEVEVARPGFVWDGSVQMAPGVPVRVHDAYVAGQGVLVPAILGLFQLTELRGGGAIAGGIGLVPTALLPGQGVSWTAIDDRSALATLTDGEVTVALIFHFGPDGLIASVRAEARERTVGGKLVPTPWEGHWFDYQRQDGMMVPMAGEVAWVLPEGPKPYWRGRITALSYRMAK